MSNPASFLFPLIHILRSEIILMVKYNAKQKVQKQEAYKPMFKKKSKRKY